MPIDLGKIAGIVLPGAGGAIIAIAALALVAPLARPASVAKVEVVHHPRPVARVDGLLRKLHVGRSSDLSFHLVAMINGKPVQMLVDTGANITVLTAADARRIGMPTDDTGPKIDVTGINSSIQTYRTVGQWGVGLGPIAVASVPIAIDDSGQLKNSILGQDAFCNIDRIQIENDAIEFIHASPVAQGCPPRT